MSVAADFISPTLGRSDVHEQLYECFDAQTLPKKRLFVLDESSAPSPFFAGLRDRRVTYVHDPGTVAKPGQGGIARARNRLLRMTSAPIIFHADDDDVYEPEWAETMADRLLSKGADLAKLTRWRMWLSGDGSIWEWDTADFRGRVWAIKGTDTPEQVDVDESIDPQILADMRDAYLIGFGFSYCYLRSLWERFPFDETEQTEDIPWVRACRAGGAKIELISDLPHLALHTVHDRSESVNFPQRRMAGAPTAGFVELPRGKEIPVTPGATFEVLASLKKKHSLQSVARRASRWGVTVTQAKDNVVPAEYGVTPARDGYRLVALTAKATKPGKLPWAVPSPLNVFDKSSVVRAWRST